MRVSDPTAYSSWAAYSTVTSRNASSAEADQATATGATGAGVDELDLSPASQRIAGALDGLWGIDSGDGKAISLRDLADARAQMQSTFQAGFNRLADEQGIDRSQTLTLTSDAEGKVRVVGDHPDKEKIEALFEDNPGLANQFRGISGLSSFLQAAKESLAFQKAYSEDPHAAVEQFSYLFDNTRHSDYQMQITGDTIEHLFPE